MSLVNVLNLIGLGHNPRLPLTTNESRVTLTLTAPPHVYKRYTCRHRKASPAPRIQDGSLRRRQSCQRSRWSSRYQGVSRYCCFSCNLSGYSVAHVSIVLLTPALLWRDFQLPKSAASKMLSTRAKTRILPRLTGTPCEYYPERNQWRAECMLTREQYLSKCDRITASETSS